MKRKLLAGMLGSFLMVRLFPAFSIFWAKQFSLPLLALLAGAGELLPFALLEWVLGGVCMLLPTSFFRRRVLSGIALAVLLACLAVWYPLYFLPQPEVSAENEAVARMCEALIDQVNAYDDAYSLPGDLPAKFIRFPQWMDALNIAGLCSFLTGEALVSPELDAASLPFVAVHESMHLRGIAGEGAANIASWEECMARGGVYAASARIWALRYGMGLLRENDHARYEACLLRMDHEALQTYREAGGAYTPATQPVFLYRLYTFLGIENVVQDYEILTPWLAAKYME